MKLTKTRRTYFEAARAVAQLSDFPKVKVGAIAVYSHHIISSGYNAQRTAPIQKKYNKYRFSDDTPASLHAEIACLKPLIRRKDIDFKRINLYVYREYFNGDLAMARPCESCFKLIKDLGIRNIYYTTNDGYAHENILE